MRIVRINIEQATVVLEVPGVRVIYPMLFPGLGEFGCPADAFWQGGTALQGDDDWGFLVDPKRAISEEDFQAHLLTFRDYIKNKTDHYMQDMLR